MSTGKQLLLPFLHSPCRGNPVYQKDNVRKPRRINAELVDGMELIVFRRGYKRAVRLRCMQTWAVSALSLVILQANLRPTLPVFHLKIIMLSPIYFSSVLDGTLIQRPPQIRIAQILLNLYSIGSS